MRLGEREMTILELVYSLNRVKIALNKVEMVLIREPENEEYKEKLRILEEEHNKIIVELVGELPNLDGDKNLRLR